MSVRPTDFPWVLPPPKGEGKAPEGGHFASKFKYNFRKKCDFGKKIDMVCFVHFAPASLARPGHERARPPTSLVMNGFCTVAR